ncbi:MAG: DUF4258 domain-containing protein [Planctomycetota bacterium]|jgi:hypothetical protein
MMIGHRSRSVPKPLTAGQSWGYSTANSQEEIHPYIKKTSGLTRGLATRKALRGTRHKTKTSKWLWIPYPAPPRDGNHTRERYDNETHRQPYHARACFRTGRADFRAAKAPENNGGVILPFLRLCVGDGRFGLGFRRPLRLVWTVRHTVNHTSQCASWQSKVEHRSSAVYSINARVRVCSLQYPRGLWMDPREKVIRYQVHAKHRMRRRGVTTEQVELAIRQPDAARPAKRPGATRFEKRLSARRRVIVIAEEDSRSFWVITAWK